MTTPPLPDFIIVGPQKCATTWLHTCLDEHPEVLMPNTDFIHYFDMFYQRDESWYRDFFSEYEGEPVVGELTRTYIRDELAPKRMAETVQDTKLIFTLRNPVDRAFSHWWHEKSKDKHSFEFEEVFENFDLYQNWVVPGFYHRHIMRYKKYFPEEQIKICFFDDLVDDDLAYARDVYSFLDIDDEYVPSVIDDRVNQGRFRSINRGSIYSSLASTYKKLAPETAVDIVRPLHQKFRERLTAQTEYEEGMEDDTRKRLEEHFIDDVSALSDYVGRDLSHWLHYHEI